MTDTNEGLYKGVSQQCGPTYGPLLVGHFQGPLGFLLSFIPRFGGVFFGTPTDANKIKAEVLPGRGGAVRIHLRIGRAEQLPRSAIEPPRVASTQPPGELVIEGGCQIIIGPPGLLDILRQVLQLLPQILKVGV